MNAPTPTNNFGTATYTFDWHNMDAMSQLQVSEAVTRILAEHGIKADPDNYIGTHSADGETMIEVKVTFL